MPLFSRIKMLTVSAISSVVITSPSVLPSAAAIAARRFVIEEYQRNIQGCVLDCCTTGVGYALFWGIQRVNRLALKLDVHVSRFTVPFSNTCKPKFCKLGFPRIFSRNVSGSNPTAAAAYAASMRTLERLVESLNWLDATKHTTCFLKCLPVTFRIFVNAVSSISDFIDIEPQRLCFVKGWVLILLNNAARTLIFKGLHPFGMAPDTRESVTDSRIARCGVRYDVLSVLRSSRLPLPHL